MTKATDLAVAVLLEAGVIEADGGSYRFKVTATATMPREVTGSVVVAGRLPWLMIEKKEPGEYAPTTPQGRIFCALKMALGMDWRDRAYDAAMYKRSARALNQLLSAFSDERECAEFVLAFGDQMKEAGIENWGIDAVVRSAYNSKGQREQMK